MIKLLTDFPEFAHIKTLREELRDKLYIEIEKKNFFAITKINLNTLDFIQQYNKTMNKNWKQDKIKTIQKKLC